MIGMPVKMPLLRIKKTPRAETEGRIGSTASLFPATGIKRRC